VSGQQLQFAPKNRLAFRRRLVLFMIAGMVWLNLLFLIDMRKGIKRGYTDFTVFYTAGTILREGRAHQLYDRDVQFEVQQASTGHIAFRRGPLPYIHPPFEALIFAPLARLPYVQAFVAWDLLSVVVLLAVGMLLRGSVGALRRFAPWKFVMGCFAFFPVFICLVQGQDSILLLLFCALGFNALKKEADALAGCWLGLGAFKFQFIIPIVLLFAIWKRRRVALGFAAVGILLTLVSVGLVGEEGLLLYPRYVMHIVGDTRFGAVPTSLLPNLHGLILGWPGPVSGRPGVALAALVSAMLFGFAALKGRVQAHRGRLELQFSLAVVVSGLIAWQTNTHDLSLLVIPLVLLVDYGCDAVMKDPVPISDRISDRSPDRSPDRTPPDRIWSNPASSFALLLPVLPLLISPLWMLLWLGPGLVNLVTIPLLWWSWRIGGEFSREREFSLQA
jgi:hypothetical protein